MSVKFGVVGLGIGARHVRSLAKIADAEMVAFADIDKERAQTLANEHGARAYSNWQALLSGEDELDAIILATPAQVREEPIRAICKRGIALFCEKPPALTLAEAERIHSVIEEGGVLNSVGFMYRWSPLADRMRDLIRNRPRLFARGVVAWPVFDWVMSGGAPKSLYQKTLCGGPLIEQAIHYQDVLRYITEDEPIAVQAMAEPGSLIPIEGRDCEETTAYLLRHESGMLSTHVHNWSHKGTVMEIQIVGDTFNLVWHMAENAMRLTGVVDDVAIDEPAESNYYFDEIVGFVNAVNTGDQTLIRSSYADACKSLAVCVTAAEAVATGQAITVY